MCLLSEQVGGNTFPPIEMSVLCILQLSKISLLGNHKRNENNRV